MNIYNTNIKLRKYLSEITVAKKRGIIVPRVIDKLGYYADKPGYFIHFSRINKLGINPRTKHATPAAIYAYPLKQLYSDFKEGKIPYASDYKYVFLFSQQPGRKILEMSRDMSSLTEKEYGRFIDKLFTDNKFNKYKTGNYNKFREYFKSDQEERFQKRIDKISKKLGLSIASINNTTRRMYAFTRYLADDNPKIWSSILTSLGIGGIIDYGTSTIHHYEPTQALFLSKQHINMIDVFKNEDTPERIRAREIRKHILDNIGEYEQLRKKGVPIPGDIVIFNDDYIDSKDRKYFYGDEVEITEHGAWSIAEELKREEGEEEGEEEATWEDVEDIVGDIAKVVSSNMNGYTINYDERNFSFTYSIYDDYEYKETVIYKPNRKFMKKIKMRVTVSLFDLISSSKPDSKIFTVNFKDDEGKIKDWELEVADNPVRVLKKTKIVK